LEGDGSFGKKGGSVKFKREGDVKGIYTRSVKENDDKWSRKFWYKGRVSMYVFLSLSGLSIVCGRSEL
jgi:hypothetical protein